METRVYKNLNNGLWSLKQRVGGKWVVIGHAREVWLRDVTPHISAARWAHVRAGHHREVFAWLQGELMHTRGFESYRGRTAQMTGGESEPVTRRVTFHPHSDVPFHYVDNGELFTFAHRVYFDAEGAHV